MSEHVISGVRRCRIAEDRLRSKKKDFDDIIMEIACRLHNPEPNVVRLRIGKALLISDNVYYIVSPAPSFQRQLKGVLKKYPLIRSDLKNHLKKLKNCLLGDRIPGHPNLIKERLALKPYKIGKRVISYNVKDTPYLFLLLNYSKSDMPSPLIK